MKGLTSFSSQEKSGVFLESWESFKWKDQLMWWQRSPNPKTDWLSPSLDVTLSKSACLLWAVSERNSKWAKAGLKGMIVSCDGRPCDNTNKALFLILFSTSFVRCQHRKLKNNKIWHSIWFCYKVSKCKPT